MIEKEQGFNGDQAAHAQIEVVPTVSIHLMPSVTQNCKFEEITSCGSDVNHVSTMLMVYVFV